MKGLTHSERFLRRRLIAIFAAEYGVSNAMSHFQVTRETVYASSTEFKIHARKIPPNQLPARNTEILRLWTEEQLSINAISRKMKISRQRVQQILKGKSSE